MSPNRLFGSRLSPFVEKVARALFLKAIDYELVELRSPRDFGRWNPQTGKIPVLEIDGERIYDSTFILRRLEQLRPEPPLFSSDPSRAAAERLLEDWADESLYWLTMALRWAEPNRAATTEQLAGTFPAWLRPLLRATLPRKIGGMARVQGMGRLPYQTLVVEYGKRLDDLVFVLGESPYLHGERPGAADLAVYGQLRTGRSGPTPELTDLISHRPALVDLERRIEAETGA